MYEYNYLHHVVIQVTERAAEVKKLLNLTKNKDALKLALQNPPIGHQDPSVKVRHQHLYLVIILHPTPSLYIPHITLHTT